jgi:hypothetical protein
VAAATGVNSAAGGVTGAEATTVRVGAAGVGGVGWGAATTAGAMTAAGWVGVCGTRVSGGAVRFGTCAGRVATGSGWLGAFAVRRNAVSILPGMLNVWPVFSSVTSAIADPSEKFDTFTTRIVRSGCPAVRITSTSPLVAGCATATPPVSPAIATAHAQRVMTASPVSVRIPASVPAQDLPVETVIGSGVGKS